MSVAIYMMNGRVVLPLRFHNNDKKRKAHPHPLKFMERTEQAE